MSTMTDLYTTDSTAVLDKNNEGLIPKYLNGNKINTTVF